LAAGKGSRSYFKGYGGLGVSDKGVMQDSGVEWIGEIPKDWIVDRIGDIALKIGSGVTPKGGASVYLDKGIPLFRSQNIHFSGLKTDDIVFISENTHQEMKSSQIRINDVLLNITGASLGRCFYFSDTCGANVNQHVCIIRPNHQVLTKFLYYFLSSDVGQKQIFSSFRGASREGLNFKEIKIFRLGFPLLKEQQKIADYLDHHCAKLDKVIALKQQQIKTLEALRQSTIYQAVTKGLDDSVPLVDSGVEWLGDIPEGWKVRKLKYVTTQIVDGTHFTPTYIDKGVPFLRVTDIQTDAINLTKVKFIPEAEHEELIKRAKPEQGDVLLSKNGTIGITKVITWDWEFSIFVSLCLIKFQPNINPYYFSYFFESDVVNKQISEGSKKTSVTNLHLVKIRELLICFPLISEQCSVVAYLDQETQRLNTLKENLNQQITTLQAYKKSLIYEMVTGKKRI